MGSCRGTVLAAAALMALGSSVAPVSAWSQDGLADGAVADPALCSSDPPDPVEYVLPTTGLVWTFPTEAPVQDCVAPPPPPVRPPAPDLFRMTALPVGEMPSLQKWRHASAGELAGHRGQWSELLDQANAVTGGNPLGMVNSWVNWHVRYRDDAGGDEWADALSTLERGEGDCEDIAVTKMALLSALGVPADEMFLVLLRDRRKAEHAILAVRREGRFYILDNRTDQVQAAEQIADYTPTFSFSGEFAWTYGRRL